MKAGTKRSRPKWAFVCVGNMPDPRVNPDNPEYGKRTVSVVFGIDSRGLLWRGIDGDAPEMLRSPPEIV